MSDTYLILGDIGLARLSSPVDMRENLEASYAEHDIIEGKTLLHYTGDRADTLELSCFFHANFCVPDEVWQQLQAMLRGHRTFLILTGAGTVLGRYVLAALERISIWADEDGTVYAFDALMNLTEYAEEDTLTSSRAEQQRTASGLRGNNAGRMMTRADMTPAVADTGKAIARMA